MSLTASTTATRGRGSMYARPALLQAQSPLLRLPAELRLHICSYMTLLPTTVAWNGAFFSCRQLHKDMLEQLHSRQEAIKYLRALPAMNMGTPHPLFGWIRSMTLCVKLDFGWRAHPFKTLYALHLDNLQILLEGDAKVDRRFPGIATPYGDLTTLGPPGLATPSGQLEPVGTDVIINCKKITLTLDQLANADGARDKQTSYEVAFKGTDIVYLFTVIQNKEGKQVERSYTFDTRFEMPTPLPPYDEEEGPHDECADERADDAYEDCEGAGNESQGTLCVIM